MQLYPSDKTANISTLEVVRPCYHQLACAAVPIWQNQRAANISVLLLLISLWRCTHDRQVRTGHCVTKLRGESHPCLMLASKHQDNVVQGIRILLSSDNKGHSWCSNTCIIISSTHSYTQIHYITTQSTTCTSLSHQHTHMYTQINYITGQSTIHNHYVTNMHMYTQINYITGQMSPTCTRSPK